MNLIRIPHTKLAPLFKFIKKVPPLFLVVALVMVAGVYVYLNKPEVIEQTVQDYEITKTVNNVKDLTSQLDSAKNNNQPTSEIVIIAQKRQEEMLNQALIQIL